MASLTQSRYIASNTRANSNVSAQPWTSTAYKSSTGYVKPVSSAKEVNTQNAKSVSLSSSINSANESTTSAKSESTGSNNMTMSEAINLASDLARESQSWSANEAQKQRDYEERLSNTAYQRAVEDLKAAGLNPVLAAKLGGASTPTGASASDSSMSSLTSGVISSAASQYASDVNRQNVLDQITSSHELAYISGMYGVQQSSIVAGATITASQLSSAASMYSSDNSLQAILTQAEKQLEASKYSSNTSYEATKYSSDTLFNKGVYDSAIELYTEQTYPKSMYSAIKGTVNDMSDLLDDRSTLDAISFTIGKLNAKYGNGK